MTTFSKPQLMKQIHAAATLGILAPADLAGVFNGATDIDEIFKRLSNVEEVPVVPRRRKLGKRSTPANLRQTALAVSVENGLMPKQRFVVTPSKKEDDDSYRLTICDSKTWRVAALGIGERIRTPAQIRAAAKRMLKRVAEA